MRQALRTLIAIVQHVITTVRIGNLNGMAQMAAYNVLFGIAPLLISVTAFASLIIQEFNGHPERPADPVIHWMLDHLPAETAAFLAQPVERALAVDPTSLLSVAGLLVIWASRGTMRSLMMGLNVAYRMPETRNPIVVQLTALGLTLSLGTFLGLASVFFVLGTSLGNRIASDLKIADSWYDISRLIRFPILGLLLVASVTVLHRFGPAVRAPFVAYIPGAVFTVVAIAVSIYGLQIFFTRFSTLDEVYGAFSSAIAFVLWVYVLALVVLLGGAINLAIWSTVAPKGTPPPADDATGPQPLPPAA